MLEQADTPAAPRPAQADGTLPAPAALDVTRVADKVYRLLLAELRLSLARGERLTRPGLPRRTRL